MATTTLKAIIDRFQAICEGGTLNLVAAQEAFSHDRQPNTVLDNSYWIEDGGLSESQSITNDIDARLDQLTVWLARRLAFAPQTAKETMETTLNTMERLLIADGPGQSYHCRLMGRTMSRPADRAIVIVGAEFLVDYDFSTAV